MLGLGLPKVSDRSPQGGHAPGIGPDPSHVYHPFGWLGLAKLHLNSDQLAVFIAAALTAALLWYVVRKTRTGLEMRAVVDRESLAALRGINQSRSSRIAWILTMMLAGLGGILITPLFQLNPDLFTLVVLGSLAAVAISGLRSIPIAFVGGMVLGVVQNLVAGYKDDMLPSFLDKISGLSSSLPFILTLVLLFFVARDRGRAAGSMADDAPAARPSDGTAGVAAAAPVGARHPRPARVRAPVDRRRGAPGRQLRAGADRARSRVRDRSSSRSSSSPASAGW